MLLQFSLTNFKNFKDTAVLDLTEAKITEFPQHLITHPSDSLSVVPIASIYGPNGSGKTNFLKGLLHLKELVLDAPSSISEDCHFAFNEDCAALPTEYDILFRCGKIEYEYQLKITGGKVTEENLFGRTFSSSSFDVLFDRDNEGVYLCPEWENTDVSSLSDQVPLLYFLGISHKTGIVQDILAFFKNISFVSYGHSSEAFVKDFLNAGDTEKDLLKHLKNMHFPITGICVENDSIVAAVTYKKVTVRYDWASLSSGTRHLLSLLCQILAGKKNHSVLLLDDPDVSLHPKVWAYMIRLITTASKGLQVLAAVHENSSMNNSLYRRDELWLTAVADNGSSSLYTLALYPKENGEKVRKDETYFKQYLEGRYGACPQI